MARKKCNVENESKKRESYQGVIAFLSEEGIDDETSDEATDTEEEATDAMATTEQNEKPRRQ
jgi:hypothetical protein